MLAFPHMPASNRRAQAATCKRAIEWLLAMQSKDGGWAAFDVDNNWEILNHVPFADHNAMLDPTCADITGRALEALGSQRLRPQSSRLPARHRLSDPHPGSRMEAGTDAGASPISTGPVSPCAACVRWGKTITNRTSSAPMNGSVPCRIPMAAGAKAAPVTTTTFIRGGKHSVANCLGADGAHGGRRYLQFQRPARHRIPDRNAAGRRRLGEELATGTGFPKVFYLNYHYYRLYFPLMALATFVKLQSTGRG